MKSGLGCHDRQVVRPEPRFRMDEQVGPVVVVGGVAGCVVAARVRL